MFSTANRPIHTCKSLVLLIALALPLTALGQTAPLASHDVPTPVDSGVVANTGTELAVVFSTRVEAPGATWLRVKFDQVTLAGDPLAGTASYLLITSCLDGACQRLNALHVRQWRNSTAYFNGDAVLIEVLAYPGTGANRLVVSHAIAGEPGDSGTRSICGTTDDRVLSDDARTGRILPVGCTGWLIDDCNHCFLTAGHCTDNMEVVEFNVPLSSSSGSLNHPGPEDQYAVDAASIQSNGGQGTGDDWGYFGCFANSTTGLTPYAAQGAAFVLTNPPAASGQPIRVTGYGTVSSPVSLTWNQVQKTHVGPFVTSSGSLVQYQTDTTGGNSGSPIIFENTGLAIGIHTHGGCDSTGGQNSGTGYNHAGLQAALANPLGICATGRLAFTYPNGLPALIAPSGGTTLRVQVSGVGGTTPQPGTGTLYYNTGGGFVAVSMTAVSQNVYDAVFPAAPCLATVQYYVSAETTTGAMSYDPGGCDPPSSPRFVISAAGINTIAAFDFETAPGWTVENVNLSSGAWERGVPIGGGDRGDPPTDYDGSGQCFVTQNIDGDYDVDGGPTRLISPTFDLSGAHAPLLSYARWFYNDDLDADRLDVELSADGGQNWVLVESVPHTPGWVYKTVAVADFIPLASTVKVRFSATDNPSNSITEAGLDAFSIRDYACPEPRAGDMNCDGVVNNQDIDHFIQALFHPEAYVADHDGDPYPPCDLLNGDFTGDGFVNNQDIDGFVLVLFGS